MTIIVCKQHYICYLKLQNAVVKGQISSKACIHMLIKTQLTKSITLQDSLSEEHLKIIFCASLSTCTSRDLKGGQTGEMCWILYHLHRREYDRLQQKEIEPCPYFLHSSFDLWRKISCFHSLS